MPYDEFVISQVAGDLRSNATDDDIVATGFLRNSMLNEEGDCSCYGLAHWANECGRVTDFPLT